MALIFFALNAAAKKLTASIPQGSKSLFGIPTPHSFTAQSLNKRRALLKFRQHVRDFSIEMVGKEGIKVWGRLGSKLVPATQQLVG